MTKKILTNSLIFILFLSPMTETFNFLIQVLFLILLIKYGTIKRIGVKYFLIASLVLSGLHGILNINVLEGVKYLNLLMGILLLPMRLNHKVINIQLLYTIFLVLVISQLGQFFSIGLITNIIGNVYVPSFSHLYQTLIHNLNTGNQSNGVIFVSKRFSGIFSNPNIFSQYIVFIFTLIILVKIKNFKQFNLISIIALLSIVLSGSRTSLFIFGFIYFYIVYKVYRSEMRNVYWLIALMIFIVFLILTDVSLFFESILSNRSFLFSSGMKSSFEVKWTIFINYLDTVTNKEFMIMDILFGNMLGNTIMFDSEYGYLIYGYGFVGFILIFIFFITLIIKSASRDSINMIVIFLLFFSISQTTFVSFRFFILMTILISLISYSPQSIKINQ